MKARNRIGIHYFLKLLHAKMQTEEAMPISPFWLMIYELEDLKQIAKSTFPEHDPKDFDKMNEKGLFEVIEQEIHMLRYLIDQMKQDLKLVVIPTQESVFETLQQLGLHTHYLATAPLEFWDEYDHNNYKLLCRKAGNPIPYYGLYKSTQEAENIVTISLIGRLHDTKEEAQETLTKLEADGKYPVGELQIMMM